ncbi:MAG: peptidylprolyl isomerase, partial [Planctomycetota bacterium]|nr:peptidylprolyl isomerase [Planctomycetota bacterium]
MDDDTPPLPESLDGPQAARSRSARGAGRLAAGSGLKRDDAVGRVGFEVGGASEGLRAKSAEVKAAVVEPRELALEAAPLEALEIDENEAAARAAAATRKVEKPAESTAALLIPEHVDEHVLAQSAAHVGEDVITLRELRRAYKQRLLQVSGGQPESLSVRAKNELARQSLEDLVDRTLLIQEAKRLVKDEKKFDLVMKDADKYWRENELKSMLQRTHMASESELASKLKSEGLSLEEVRDDFRAMFISRGFQRSRLESKLSAGMTEQYEYYEKHIHEYDEPARVTWREIEVVCGRHRDRAAARRKAEAVLERLRRNEDFEATARKYSEGPTRAAGGLWTTAPESYGEPAVRRALQTLPTRQ